jgi:hypothetical protein
MKMVDHAWGYVLQHAFSISYDQIDDQLFDRFIHTRFQIWNRVFGRFGIPIWDHVNEKTNDSQRR